jgi:O-antigen/teichoic acid export membrane protein
VLLACVRGLRPVTAYVAVQSGVLATTRPALVAAVAVAGLGTVAALIAWAAPVAAAALAALALVAGPLRLARGVSWPAAAQWRSFWSFALPRGISAAIDAAGVGVGVLLTSVLAGPAQAGIFSAVGRYAMAGLLIMQGLRIAVAPQLSRLLSAGQTAGAAAVYRRATVFIIALSWPGYLVLAAFAPGFLRLFGHEFAGAAPALMVLCAAMLVNCGVGNAQTVLLMSGNSRRHLAATIGGLLVTVVLGLLLIPGLGALGAAYSWAAGIVVENVVVALAARAVLRVPIVNTSTVLAAIGGLGVVALPVALGLLTGGRGPAGLVVTAGSLVVGACVLLAFPYARTTLRRLPTLLTKDAR